MKTANWNGGFLTFEDCEKLFTGKHANETELKLKHETIIYRQENDVGRTHRYIISLFGHPIIGICEGRMWLDTCGYKTYTTKDRWNTFIPPMWGVYQDRGQWYISFHGLTVSKIYEDETIGFRYSPYKRQWLLYQ